MSLLPKSIIILWPELEPPDIFEMRFAYDFCRKESQELCQSLNTESLWIDYAIADPLQTILSRISENDDLLVITDPVIVLQHMAVESLQRTLMKGYAACGPVFNESPFTAQKANLDCLYHNMDTFLEVARLNAKNISLPSVAADPLDPGCILFSGDAVMDLAAEVPIVEISKHLTKHSAVDTSALIHRFFNIFDAPRDDLITLVPDNVARILDVGCARGGYGKCLKAKRPEIFLAGVEMNPLMAESARQYYDDVFVCSVDSLDLPYTVDLINCGELLEHLDNPWKVLVSLSSILKPKGYLVLSVPNAGHWGIIRDLIRGSFQYIPWGPQCITHIRWFTENDVIKALKNAGFSIDLIERIQPMPTPLGNQFIQDLLCNGYGDKEQLLTIEIIIRAQKL